MASKAFKQDLPPEGGYAPVNFKRIPARTIIQGKWLLAAFVGYQIGAAVYYGKVTRPAAKKGKTEYNGFRLAVAPLLLAERDREYVKQVKKNRDAEEELMADVEGWETGTWFGQPVYYTVPDHKLLHYYSVGMISPEYGAHFDPTLWKSDVNEWKSYWF